ncbi:MAG TPA: translocation/assembly module TamB domain-containing protein [Candidatus Angelobacter sp.]|nr:translocation/assembly module TamB domain-containing protein [Candidatus Angelobacter sp.]
MTPESKEQAPPGRKKRRFRRGQAILGTLLLVSVLWLGLYLRSDAFRELVRKKVVAELELVTGGKVEIQSLTWNLSRLQFEAKGVTIHGREAADQTPFVQVDRIAGQAKIISFFGQGIGLRSLVIDHPAIHLILYPDGTTNQPMPKIREQDNSQVQRLFDLAVNSVEIHSAELRLNDSKIPFDFAGDHLSGGMSYAKAGKDYEGNFSIELRAVHYQGLEPLHGTLELHFVMHPSQLEVKTLKFTMDHSVLQASGGISNYIHPEVHLQYSASLELAEAGRVARVPQLQAGHLDMNGKANYQNQKYAAQGTLTASNMSWHEAGWNLTGVDVASSFLFTPEKISLAPLKARAFGGGAQGELEIVNWNSPPTEKKAQERGTLNLRLSGMQAAQLDSALSTRRLPLDKINLVGQIGGDVKSTWAGAARNMAAAMKLEVDPPANPAPRQLPVTASFQGTYHHGSGILDVGGLSFATRGIRLNATGTLGSSTAQLKIAFNANSLQEIQPVLAAWSSDARVPMEVHGRASFNGTLFGKLDAISARGRLDLEDFDTLMGPIHSLLTKNAVERIHWDSVLTDVLLTPSSVSAQNGLLKRGAAQVIFSGSASLNQGQFDARTSQVTVNLQVQNASLEDVETLTGFGFGAGVGVNPPVTGSLNANVRATGTLGNLRGSGNLAASRLTIYGEPFTSFHSNINFAGQETQFGNILLSHNGAQVKGSAAVNASARLFRFDLSGTGIELKNFSRFEPQRFTMAGRTEFHISASGTLASPVVNAQLNVRGLVLNGELVGDLTASAETHGENMLLHASSNFQNAIFNLDGSMRLRDNYPAQMTLKFEHLDFDPLIRAYVKAPVTGHSSMQGYIEVRGPMKTPRALSIVANISELSANVENIKVQNDGPLRFSVSNQALHVDQFHLTGTDMDISLTGDASMGGTQALDVRADGKVDMKLLETFQPNLTSSGRAELAVHLTGTIGQPQMRGRIDITNGAISAVDLPNGLSQINGRLIFAQDRMQIENLRAHSGGGDLDLAGFITVRGGLYFDVTATGSDVRLRYPPGLSASGNASLRYTGSAQSSLLSGNVTITRFAVDPRFDFAQYLARAKSTGRGGTQNPFLENLRLDVHIASAPELRVETSLAKISGDVDLRIRGTLANPAVLGRVTIVEGNVSFNGTKYRLERGDVTFSNPQLIQPIINVEMAGRVRDYDITIGFHGPVDRLNITYRSDPPLPSSDIIALLAFGRTKQEDIYSNQTTSTLTTSDTMLEQALTTASSSRVQKLFGVGSVKIDPQVIGAENNLGPRVTIEQQIQNNITLTYITNLAQSSSEQVIQVEYNLTRSISIVAVRDQNGILAFEVRVRKRKK